MKFPLAIFNKAQKQQELKERILKNREGVLDTLGHNIKGAHQCPFLLGQKCIGQFCEMFMQFYTVNESTNEKTEYWRCAFIQLPILLIELNTNIRKLSNKGVKI